LRVLLLSTSLDPGGAEHILLALARGLRVRGFEVEAASLLPAGAIAARLREEAFPVHELGGHSKLFLPVVLARVAGLLRRSRYDVVQSFLFHGNVVARLAAVGLATPVVTGIQVIQPGRPRRQLLERLLAPLATRVVCCSEAAHRALAGPGADPRYVVIRNAVAIPETAAKLAPSAPWISVGRLHAQKRPDVLVEAWRRLGTAAPPLRIAGSGPLEERIREAAAGLPVELLGARGDVPALLASSGGFVLASDYEGLPLALLEAMATGLPCVATAVDGVPEALEHGREGLLVPPGDPAALAGAVASLVRDPGRARALGAAARERVRRDFSADAMIDAYARLYRDLRSSPPKA
jgi:glycosyltransferase involved in cell wall biosynthesis